MCMIQNAFLDCWKPTGTFLQVTIRLLISLYLTRAQFEKMPQTGFTVTWEISRSQRTNTPACKSPLEGVLHKKTRIRLSNVHLGLMSCLGHIISDRCQFF